MSYPTAAMLSNVIIPIQTIPITQRMGVKYGIVIFRVTEYCGIGSHMASVVAMSKRGAVPSFMILYMGETKGALGPGIRVISP